MIGPLLACLSLLAPPVQVEVDGVSMPEAQLQQLHGQLLTRLVEEGRAVGRPGVVYLRMTGDGQAIRVEVQHGRHAIARTVDGEGAVLRLAAIHAALELLEALDASAHATDPALVAEPERTVVVEAGAGGEALVPAAIEAVVAAGMVVVDQAEHGHTLCVGSDAEGGARIGVVPRGEPCEPDRPVEELRVEVDTALSEARKGQPSTDEEPTNEESTDEEPTPNEPAAEVEASILTEPEPPPTSMQTWRPAVGLGAGVQGRLRSAEALLVVDAAARHSRGLTLLFRGSFAPSRGGPLRAYDSFASIGVGWRLQPRPRLALQAGLMAGASIHAFALRGDGGVRGDLNLELPLELAVPFGRRFELAALPLLGWTARARRHTEQERTLWSRDRLRVGAAVVFRISLPSGETPAALDG